MKSLIFLSCFTILLILFIENGECRKKEGRGIDGNTKIKVNVRKEEEDDSVERKGKGVTAKPRAMLCRGKGSFPHISGDCTKFLQCNKAMEKPVVMVCDPKKRFDPIEKRCLTLTEARDCNLCKDKTGKRMSDPKSRAAFYECQNNFPKLFRCGAGKVYSTGEKRCVKDESPPPQNQIFIQEIEPENHLKIIPKEASPNIIYVDRAPAPQVEYEYEVKKNPGVEIVVNDGVHRHNKKENNDDEFVVEEVVMDDPNGDGSVVFESR